MSKPVVLTRRAQLQEFLTEARRSGRTVGFVPTMGALHPGHGSLVARSAAENDLTLVSIFVNPKQFGPNEDFSRYPRTLSDDIQLVSECGGQAVFAPSINEMYPESFLTEIRVSELDTCLCGAHRPGHFDGVCTVVLLLLNLAGARKAYFGMKDFQQLQIIRRMCRDLAHPTEIVPVPTVREVDGLALSSRNRYLDAEARRLATAIPRALAQSAKSFLNGERSATALEGIAMECLQAATLQPQYLEVRDAETLQSLSEPISRAAVLAVAQPMRASSGTCRLIDNVVFSTEPFYLAIIEDLMRRTGV